MHLAAGLGPDPLGELTAHPKPLAVFMVRNSKGREGEGQYGRGGIGSEGMEGERRKEK